jgi:hypothetical protein
MGNLRKKSPKGLTKKVLQELSEQTPKEVAYCMQEQKKKCTFPNMIGKTRNLFSKTYPLHPLQV